MVPEPTPVKKLLAEQLAVPYPQLSLFLLSLVSILLPLLGISPCVYCMTRVCFSRCLPQSGVRMGERFLHDTWAVWVRVWCKERGSFLCVCVRCVWGWVGWHLFPSLSWDTLSAISCASLSDLSHSGATSGTIYTSGTTANKEKNSIGFVFYKGGGQVLAKS